MADDSEDRAKRLAGRWGQPHDDSDDDTDEQTDRRTDEQAYIRTDEQPDKDTDEQPSVETGAQTGDSDETPQREKAKQMVYLEDDVKDDLDVAFQTLALRYRRDRGEDLQKSRDFLEPLLKSALEELGDVAERDLDELDEDLGR